jgi:cytidine deaminase
LKKLFQSQLPKKKKAMTPRYANAVATPEYLVEQAEAAMARAIAPHSEFKVGAALQTKSGKVYTGCNIESSSYSLTICAERTAIFKALSEGEREFSAIAITASSDQFCPPCGACRQVLMDFAGNIDVILSGGKKSDGEKSMKKVKLGRLLPMAFDASHIL